MLITGTFKDLDNNTISVQILNKDISHESIVIGDTDLDDVYFASDPIRIETQCDDMFTHVMKKSCTISLVTKIYLGEYLFANNIRSIVVNVFKNDDCIFAGYVTPNTYSQGYSNMYEELDIQCVDILSTMQYEYLCSVTNYETEKSQLKLTKFKDILGTQCKLTNNDYIVSNYPISTIGTEIWVETWFRKIGNAYYALETKVIKLDDDAAIRTGETRQGRLLEIFSRNGDISDPEIVNGKRYYKRYIWVTINGTDEINTGDWFRGDLMPDPEVEYLTWEETGVMRTGVHQYYVQETSTAHLDDGSVINNYSTRAGTQLSYVFRMDTVSHTMYVDDVEYYVNVPMVTWNDNKYYFHEDEEAAFEVGTYSIEGEHVGDISIDRDRGYVYIQNQEIVGGSHFFGVYLEEPNDLSALFENEQITKIVVTRHAYVDVSTFCQNCIELRYARIDAYGLDDIGGCFDGCYDLSVLVWNVIELYEDDTDYAFNNMPNYATIFVQDDQLEDYNDATPYNNFTIRPISNLGIRPIERSLLPQGYTQMTYVTNPSTAYVNTGIQTSRDYLLKIETTIRFNEIRESNTYIGCSNNFFGHTNTGFWTCSGNTSSTSSPTAGTVYNVMMNRTAYNRIIFTVGNELVCSSNRSLDTTLFNVMLYGYSTGASANRARCSLGRTKIYINDDLKADLIPCYDRSHGIYGFYDIVRNTFLSSASNTALTGE